MEQPEKNIKLAYDGEIHLAVGASKPRKMEKSADVLVGFYPTIENADSDTRDCRRLQKMPKSKQGEVKDVGAFIGGWLKEGRRKEETRNSVALLR